MTSDGDVKGYFGLILAVFILSSSNSGAEKAIPLPPKQGKPWEAPNTKRLPASWLNATRTLLEAGLADPRGCSYHEIDITIEHFSHIGRPVVEILTTHGWVLPDQKHAVCWSGWVYPVSRVGDEANLPLDVWAMMKQSPNNWRSWAPPRAYETYVLDKERFFPIRVALLLVLGKADLAEDHWGIWKVLLEKQDRIHRENPLWFFAQDWLNNGNRAAVRTFKRRQDRLATSIITQCQAAIEKLRPLLIQAGFIKIDRSDPFYYLSQLQWIAKDIQRREGKDQTLPEDWTELSPKAFVEKLEHVSGTVDVFHPTDYTRAAQTLGDRVIPLLIDSLENDDRLTRTNQVHIMRDSGPEVLPVSGLSYLMLTRILNTRLFGDQETHFNPMNRDDLDRKKIAKLIRTYWTNEKAIPGDQ